MVHIKNFDPIIREGHPLYNTEHLNRKRWSKRKRRRRRSSCLEKKVVSYN
jgi:hypothetical protein